MNGNDLPDYVWDKSGAKDPEAEKLEKLLAPLAARPARVPRRRFVMLLPAIASALTILFVALALAPERVPARIAGIFHGDLAGQIGIEGGTRIEYAVTGEADLELSEKVAEGLKERGAKVVFVKAGTVVVDVAGVSPEEVEDWSSGIGAFGSFGMTIVEENSELMRRIYDKASSDPKAAELGITVDTDSWRHDQSNRRFQDFYIFGETVAVLEDYLAHLADSDPSLAPPPGFEFAFEFIEPGPYNRATVDGFRSYLVSKDRPLTHADIGSTQIRLNDMTGGFDIEVDLTNEGGRKFGLLTAANVGRKLAIILDDRVQSAPTIQEPIDGGRAIIYMAAAGQAETEGLAAALRTGPLAAPIERVSTTRVEASASDSSLLAGRFLFALPFGLLAFVLGALLARRLPPINPAVARLTRAEAGSRRSVLSRFVVTGLVAAFTAHLDRFTVPGINSKVAEGFGIDMSSFSLFNLGIYPLLSAFVLVELAALAVPAWRHLRVNGPRGRAKLAIATAVLGIAIAAVMAWSLTKVYAAAGIGFDTLLPHGLGPSLLCATSLVAGMLVLVLLAAVVNRHGIGNGYMIVLLTPMVLEGVDMLRAITRADHSASTLGVAVLFVVVTSAATLALLRWRLRGDSTFARYHLPTCGFVPIAWAGAIAVAATQLVAVGFQGWPISWMVEMTMEPSAVWTMVAAGVLGVVLSIAFSRAVRFKSAVRVIRGVRDSSRAFWLATAISTAAMVVLVGLMFATKPYVVPGVLWIAFVTAAVLDLVAEVRAHWRNGDLVSVWGLHRVQLVDSVVDSLTAAGIDAHTQSLHLRKLFFFFAPYFPIMVMVPRERADEARDVIAAVVSPPA